VENSRIKSSDQVAQCTVGYNMSIIQESTKGVYSRKCSRNIPHEISCRMHRISDWRSLPYNRLHAFKLLNEDLFQIGTIRRAMADQLSLSMGIFPSTYRSSVLESWRTINSVNEFKSVLAITGEPDSIGHPNRLMKFGAYPILEETMERQVMQRNGRAKNVRAMTVQ
jgi:hypothetical protein